MRRTIQISNTSPAINLVALSSPSNSGYRRHIRSPTSFPFSLDQRSLIRHLPSHLNISKRHKRLQNESSSIDPTIASFDRSSNANEKKKADIIFKFPKLQDFERLESKKKTKNTVGTNITFLLHKFPPSVTSSSRSNNIFTQNLSKKDFLTKKLIFKRKIDTVSS